MSARTFIADSTRDGSIVSPAREQPVVRREWLRTVAGIAAGFSGLVSRTGPVAAANEAQPEPTEAEEELDRAEDQVKKVTKLPLRRLQSPHYQAIGDASEQIIKLTLSDCEQVATDFLKHYRAKGFPVNLPDRRLSLVVFRDERPFLRFAGRVPHGTIGFYNRSTNWLSLFDARNVPMNLRAAGQTNLETMSHEATHQLCYNSGLLDRESDIPLCVDRGPGHVWRASSVQWSERAGANQPQEAGGAGPRPAPYEMDHRLGPSDRRSPAGTTSTPILRTLGYAESWLLIYHLMTDARRLPQFRAYLEALRPRRDKSRRLEDAQAHFGDLERLDQELRQASIRLQRAP